MAHSPNIEIRVEDRVLDVRPIESAMENPAIVVPAEDEVLLRIVRGDGLRGLARVVGDVDGWVVVGFHGGLLGHAVGSVAAGHRSCESGFVIVGCAGEEWLEGCWRIGRWVGGLLTADRGFLGMRKEGCGGRGRG